MRSQFSRVSSNKIMRSLPSKITYKTSFHFVSHSIFLTKQLFTYYRFKQKTLRSKVSVPYIFFHLTEKNHLYSSLSKIFVHIRRNMPLSISQLPIEKIYRIFDQLNNKELFIFINHDNQRLNAILNSYPRFQVNLANIQTSFTYKF